VKVFIFLCEKDGQRKRVTVRAENEAKAKWELFIGGFIFIALEGNRST
jgi:hypothetical protein